VPNDSVLLVSGALPRPRGGWTCDRDRACTGVGGFQQLEGSRQTIGRDYALTAGISGLAARPAAGRPIRQMIDHLDEHFGGSREYLTWLGLSVSEVDALIRRLA
jgi:hypothetical protein